MPFTFAWRDAILINVAGKTANITLAWLFDLTDGDEAIGDYNEGGEQDGIDSRT